MLVAIGYFVEILRQKYFLGLFWVPGKFLLVSKYSLIGDLRAFWNDPRYFYLNLLVSFTHWALIPLFKLLLFLNLFFYKSIFMLLGDGAILATCQRTFSRARDLIVRKHRMDVQLAPGGWPHRTHLIITWLDILVENIITSYYGSQQGGDGSADVPRILRQ